MHCVFGQNHALGVLRSAMHSGRIHHAWIFHGPKGVGKFTTALAFAKQLLDPTFENTAMPLDASSAGGRASRLVDSNNHPDLHIIRKEDALYSSNPELRRKKLTNIPIDLMRERMIGGFTGDEKFHEARVALAPSMKHSKVFVIDEAELLDPVGQNAVLKTLEEPPPRTYIVLVTTQPDKLLPTIRSRCPRVSFGRLDEQSMHLWYRSSGLDVPPAQREWILEFADGAPGVAVIAIEDGLFEWHEQLSPLIREVENGRFPQRMGETLAGFVDSYASAFVKKQANASKEMANNDGTRRVLLLLAWYARKRLAETIANGDDPEPTLRFIDLCTDAERSINQHVNMKLVWENLVAQWVNCHAQAYA